MRKGFWARKTELFRKVGLSLALALPAIAHGQFSPVRGLPESNLSAQSFYSVLVSIMRYGLAILTIVGVIGFIVSGLMFITGGAETARKWLVNSIIGIVVGISGYIIIRLLYGITLGIPEL